MARIAGVDLPMQKMVKIALTYIYGIGDSRAAAILGKLQCRRQIDGHGPIGRGRRRQFDHDRRQRVDERRLDGCLRAGRRRPKGGQAAKDRIMTERSHRRLVRAQGNRASPALCIGY